MKTDGKRKGIRRFLLMLFALFAPIFVLSSCSANSDSASNGSLRGLEDFKTSSIGVLTGSNHPEYVKAALPDSNILYFNTLSDLVVALRTGKVSAFAADDPVARNVCAQYSSISTVPGVLGSFDYAFVFPKTVEGSALCQEMSDFIDALDSRGVLEELQNKWFDSPDLEKREMMDYGSLPNDKGLLHIAAIQSPPFAFSRGFGFAGYDVEISALFCKERGYAMEIHDVNADAAIPGVVSGKFDMDISGFTVTDERKGSVNFTSPVYKGGIVLLALNGAEEGNKGFFASIANSFESTFIREERWRLFVSGIVTTLVITGLSILCGTILGFLVFLPCRKGNKVANGIARFCVWLVQGMPAVVLIMILFYIVFGRVSISGEAVSVIGFTLIFGSAVFNMLKSGVNTVEKGQTEAALALGYRGNKAFFRIVLPQAMPHILPQFKGEVTSLIKATAIVGYVAVQDITKIGDIVRSRTFEPFFPLITVAIVYFALAGLLILLVRLVSPLFDPRRRKNKKLLKGVKQR